ncbi:MAG: T9SS type A sorting domain-containing protein [Bacteroidota bacterium]
MKLVYSSLFTFLILFGLFINLNAQCFSNSSGGSFTDFTVPINTNTVTISATGADGGDEVATGGAGGSVLATFSVNVGDVLRVIVGAAGADHASTAGGGGGTAVINCGNPADCPNGTLLVVAGGGGGAAGGSTGGGGVINPGTGQGGAGLVGAGGGGIISDGADGFMNTGGQGGLETAVSNGGAGDAQGGAGYGGGGAGTGHPAAKGGGGGGGYSGGGGGLAQGGTGGSNFISEENFGTSSNTAGIAGGSNGDNSPGSVIITCSFLLPVELLDFRAAKYEETIQLKWRTGSEINNFGFAIERSTDAINWQPIGFVDGQGNSLETRNYYYSDEHPFSGVNYYRLKQMDYDGEHEYSKILSVALNSSTDQLRLFPNPTTDLVNLEFESDFVGPAVWEMLDFTGRRVAFKSVLLDGTNSKSTIGLSEIPPGIYLLQLTFGQKQIQQRLVVK